MKPFFMMAWQRSGVQFWSALYLSSTEGMGGSWVKSWENVWRIHLEEEWGSRECFLMYPAPGNGCRQGINTDNTGGVRRLEGGREGGKGWRGVREGEGRVLNGVWRGGYLLRKGGCYSKCQLTEIEMTDFLTSSEFVVTKKCWREDRRGWGGQMEALGRELGDNFQFHGFWNHLWNWKITKPLSYSIRL